MECGMESAKSLIRLLIINDLLLSEAKIETEFAIP